MKDRGWENLIHADHVARVVEGREHCWRMGDPWEDTFPLLGKDGTYRWFLSRAQPIRDANGHVVRWLGTNTAITERKQAEDALIKSARLAAMGRLAGIIAHEINNPLEAISNAFYLLRDHPSLDEEPRYYSRLAEEELARVAHISKQTLSFYRDSRQLLPVALAEILDNVLELQSRCLQLNGIAVEKQYRCDGVVQGFAVELKQVFLNIIGNAVQAMPFGGRLRVRLCRSLEWSKAGVVYAFRYMIRARGFDPNTPRGSSNLSSAQRGQRDGIGSMDQQRNHSEIRRDNSFPQPGTGQQFFRVHTCGGSRSKHRNFRIIGRIAACFRGTMVQHKAVILCIDDKEKPLVLRKLALQKQVTRYSRRLLQKRLWRLWARGRSTSCYPII
jgi:PAS fold/His Kinase A (phospho-acceptor) domain